MKEMVVTIDKDGNITVDVNGIDGSECLRETKQLEEQLGVVIDRTKKPDYYRKAKISNTTRISR